MYPLDFNGFSDSPVIIISPHQHQFDPISRAAHFLHQPKPRPVMDSRPYDKPLPVAVSTKRSAENMDDESPPPPPAPPSTSLQNQSQMPIPQGDAFFAEALSNTLIDSNLAKIIADTKAKELSRADVSLSSSDSDKVHPRKKSRNQTTNDLDCAACSSLFEDDSDHDRYATAIGVGWRSLPDDPIDAAAIRGSEKAIQRMYQHLNFPYIIAINKSKEQYLVRANEGHYVFREDCHSGQFVSGSYDETCEMLKKSPPTYGGDVIKAYDIELFSSGSDGDKTEELVESWKAEDANQSQPSPAQLNESSDEFTSKTRPSTDSDEGKIVGADTMDLD